MKFPLFAWLLVCSVAMMAGCGRTALVPASSSAVPTSSTIPASSISVATPSNNSQVSSPFNLTANTASCGSQPAASMGYSIDSGSTTIEPTSFSAAIVAENGQHTLRVKCWGTSGAADETDLNINVTVTQASQTPPPPAVTTTSNLQNLNTWVWNSDPGTPGSATGSSETVSTPSLSGSARHYFVSFSDSGGEIFYTSFGSDPNATHFMYDAEVWIEDPAVVGNVEMDLNQVLANGDTVIYGVQCDGYTGTWDYTINTGTPADPIDTWIHSNAQCPKPSTWTANAWHHVQIAYSRDAAGTVTYESATLDGNKTDFQNATGNSAFSLGWSSVLLTNFQIDGLGSNGSTNVYVDNMTVYRW